MFEKPNNRGVPKVLIRILAGVNERMNKHLSVCHTLVSWMQDNDGQAVTLSPSIVLLFPLNPPPKKNSLVKEEALPDSVTYKMQQQHGSQLCPSGRLVGRRQKRLLFTRGRRNENSPGRRLKGVRVSETCLLLVFL